MRLASPQELQTEATPALRIHLPEKELSRLFPVRMKTLDPLNEPEPSKGALVQLSSGDYVVLIYGKTSQTLTVAFPHKATVQKAVQGLLEEVPIPARGIVWQVQPPKKRAAHPKKRSAALRTLAMHGRGTALRRSYSNRVAKA